MAGGELRLGTASMYMAGVYHHITIKSINKYPFTWLHICGQTNTSRAKSGASCFATKEDQFKIHWYMVLPRNLALPGLNEETWMVDQLDWDLRLGYLIYDVSRLRGVVLHRALARLVVTRT